MQLASSIFREYDIRGIAGISFSSEEIAKYEKWYGPFPGITLTPEAVLEVGKAYGTMIRRAGGKRVVVGYEVRPSGKELKDMFDSGIRSPGCDVVDAGIALTPIIYFATAFLGFDGGVNVTGSHNVYFYNGFKLMKKDVWPLFGQELQGMRKIIEQEDYEQQPMGQLETTEMFPVYEKYFLEHIKLSRKLRVVIDTGNGSAGIFAPGLFEKLGCEVIGMYTEPDATFPNHDPDPEGPQNMVALGKRVVEEKADLGIAFDADGDRGGFVDEQGRFISADLPLLLFAKDALSRHPGKKILYDTKCSQLLEELIPQYGGIPMMHRTGHAPIKETLRKDPDVIFGGEVSGHFFFVEDYFKIDDGAFAAGKMLELYSNQTGPFSAMFKDIPQRVRTPEIKLPCADEEKFEVVRQITEDLKNQYPSVLIDGVRIQVTEKAWGIIRASNTSPYLTVRVEGASKEEVLKVKNILADELEKFPQIQDKLNRSEIVVLEGKLGWV
ncbi:MAG: phosphomannomutase/phosphoglucomutase [bacterium]|nr:phosphomannomutase/phosphoglucomutase [bacterium]